MKGRRFLMKQIGILFISLLLVCMVPGCEKQEQNNELSGIDIFIDLLHQVKL